MAGLIKRGKTYYALYYIGDTQKRISLKTSSFQIAKAKLSEIEISLKQGADSPLPTRTPLTQALQQYLGYMKTAKSYRSIVRDTCILRLAFGPIVPELEIVQNSKRHRKNKNRPHIETGHIENITTAMVSNYFIESVQRLGLTSRTINRHREVLSRLFTWSMKCGGVRMPNNHNPVTDVQRYREKTSDIRFLTLAQINEQLNALNSPATAQLQTMVAMYIYAGLRREEALWLQREDIDLRTGAHGIIRIRAKEVNGHAWQPKTCKNRAVPISSTLRTYLDNYIQKPSIGDWYFPSPNGYWYNPDNFSKALARHQRKAGLRWTCLDFRHTFGSHLAMKGESLYKISTLMGNSPEICRTHYAALVPEELSDSVEFDTIAPDQKYIKLA